MDDEDEEGKWKHDLRRGVKGVRLGTINKGKILGHVGVRYLDKSAAQCVRVRTE